MTRIRCTLLVVAAAALLVHGAQAAEKPNILVIFGDDIGWFNPSAYNMGMLGYRTPNIDRIAREGVLFTDAYGQQSCTAGRSAFITGQSPKRTGLIKIGMPGDPLGLQAEDPTLAELLEPHGYSAGQFGKNHLGDRDEHLPTNHGFEEFFGNLYHLNAEEEPENPDYPEDPSFRERFGPRGVIRSSADGRVEDTGLLSRARMETVDEEFLAAAIDFMERKTAAKQPWLLWFNSTRMHMYTHLKEGVAGQTGRGIYADGMVEHDGHVGQLLDRLDALGIAENTIVIYSTDNGAQKFTWPDGGNSPFRGEKATTWEGGIRVPLLVRWPARIEGGQIANDMISHEDWVPTLMAAVGEPAIKEKLLQGHRAAGKDFRVHLDGYNFLPYLTGQAEAGPRDEFFAWVDDGTLGAVRVGPLKANFSSQDSPGIDAWLLPQKPRKAPMIVDLRADPFEGAPFVSSYYDDWIVRRMFLIAPIIERVQAHMATYREFPPRQGGGSFMPDD
jgi:arylsulfatase A-like enzyme